MSINGGALSGSRIETTLEQLETRCLDPMGYVPVMSTATGGLRFGLACSELLASVVALVSALAICMFGSTEGGRELAQAGWKYFSHGCANMARSIVEIIPFLNMITMAYDGSLDAKNGSDPYAKPGRFTYIVA